MRQTSLGLLAAALAMPMAATAQSRAPGLTVGDTVRIKPMQGNRLRGVVSRIDDAGFVLQRGVRGDTAISPLATGARVERLAGRKSRLGNLGRGALIGLGTGLVTGAVLGYASYSEDSFLSTSAESDAAIGAVVLGVLLTPVGALFGLAQSTERWSVVALDGGVESSAAPFLRADPIRGQVSVGLSFAR